MKPECEGCEVVENVKKALFDYRFIYTLLVGLVGGVIFLTANATNLENQVSRNAEKLAEHETIQKEYAQEQKEIRNCIETLRLETQRNGLKIDDMQRAVTRMLDRFDKVVAHHGGGP